MALLSQMFRRVAITGRTDSVNAWFASRQAAPWVERTVKGAFPNVPEHGRSDADRDIAELERRGILTEEEARTLRTRRA
jgi:hypothetical protein